MIGFILFLVILFFILRNITNITIDYFHGGGVSYPFGNMAAYVRRSYPCGYRGYPYDTVYPTSTPYPFLNDYKDDKIPSFV